MTVPVIAFLTMKGGVGKTTLAANITRALADQKKRRILLIDGDAQCNLSQVFFDSEVIEAGGLRSLYQVFDSKSRLFLAGDLKTTIYQSPHGSQIDFITGSFDTFEFNATANAARRSAATVRFKHFIDQAKRDYDLVLIDTNPSATFVTMQALENANFLVAPITFDAFSLQGIHLIVHHLKATFQWLDNPTRLCLVANKVPRAPSDSDLRRMEREENKIKFRYPRLARSIKLERIHSSNIIANRPAAKGFIADHNGRDGGNYYNVVQDFIAVATAIDLDLEYAFDSPSPPKSDAPSNAGWSVLGNWFGASAERP